MRDRKEYMRDYYQRKKEAANIGMTLVKTPPQQDGYVTESIHQRFEPVLTAPSKPLQDNGLTSLNRAKIGLNVWVGYVTGCVLGVFILANTAFLVNEQIRYYMLKGYSIWYALFVAILCESAVILLSFVGATLSGGKRFMSYFSLVLTIAAILGVVFLGVDRMQSGGEKNAEIAELLRTEVKTLESQIEEKPKLKSKLLARQEELRTFLQKNYVASGGVETFMLTALRILAVFWNVIFASLVSFFIKRE